MTKREFLRDVRHSRPRPPARRPCLGAIRRGSRSIAWLRTKLSGRRLDPQYRLKPDYINLESGYYSMQATPVLEAFVDKVREVNHQASYYLRTTQVPDKAAARDKLAALAGCSPAELCITRNTTESIATVVNGYDWKPSDEAVQAEQDYGHMLAQFRLIARRYGMVNRLVSVPPHPRTDDEVVSVYAKAITPRTRLLMVSHMINITGHILPVRKIADMAHARGVDVLVDGAHAFAHFDYRIPDTGADYYAASLHKWLGCPLGTGILYVRKDKIPGLGPIYGDWRMTDDADIMKLNHTGTHPVHTDLAIEPAIAFHTHSIRYSPQGGKAPVSADGLDLEGPWAAERDHEHAVGSSARLRDCKRRHQGRCAGRSGEDASRQGTRSGPTRSTVRRSACRAFG